MDYKTDSSGWSADLYNKNASFVYSAAFTSPVLDLLNAQSGERIIDLGCGSGEITFKLQQLVGEDNVVGVDASESMIKKSKENGVAHAFISDIQDLTFPDTDEYRGFVASKCFDAVFTNATLHWCKRSPVGVIRSAKRVLKSGGRFVGEFGGMTNCIGIRCALHQVLKRRSYDPSVLDPWYFPSMEEYAELLKSEGFQVTHVSLTPRITPLPAGVAGWLDLFVRNSFLKELSDEQAEDIIKEVEDICRVDCQDGKGKWTMMYTRLRFVAVLP